MKGEIWKPIPGYEDRYEASNHGRIKRLSRPITTKNRYGEYGKVLKEKIMSQHVDAYGYMRVNLVAEDGIRTNHTVHYLVAAAFLGLPARDNLQINHKDCDKTNNNISNLEWCTASHNQRHAYKNGIQTLNKHRCKRTGRILPLQDGAGRYKVCKKCNERLPIEQFSVDKRKGDGWRQNICNSCRSLSVQVLHDCRRNREIVRLYSWPPPRLH